MDALFAFLAKIGTTARVGAVIALCALLVAILRWMNVEPLASIDKSIYGIIVAAGIFGFCAVVVEFTIWISGVVKKAFLYGMRLWEVRAQRKRNREAALKNLQILPPEFLVAFSYLKANNKRRFLAPGPARNAVLRDMVRSFLIEIDDPNFQPTACNTYYSVPDHVWDGVERAVDFRSIHVPEEEPWLLPRSRWSTKPTLD
jgi:hypothetical protein